MRVSSGNRVGAGLNATERRRLEAVVRQRKLEGQPSACVEAAVRVLRWVDERQQAARARQGVLIGRAS